MVTPLRPCISGSLKELAQKEVPRFYLLRPAWKALSVLCFTHVQHYKSGGSHSSAQVSLVVPLWGTPLGGNPTEFSRTLRKVTRSETEISKEIFFIFLLGTQATNHQHWKETALNTLMHVNQGAMWPGSVLANRAKTAHTDNRGVKKTGGYYGENQKAD